MGHVLTHMCMSLDGFVAQPDDDPAELFEWYWGGDVEVPSAQASMSFSVDTASAVMLRELISGTGAMISGRRLFDQTDGWGDNHPVGAPVVVVTHRPPPADAAERFPRTTFTGSVEEAVATAKAIASSPSPAPTSSSRRSPWASSTRCASPRCPCCSAPGSATSASSSAATSCSRTPT